MNAGTWLIYTKLILLQPIVSKQKSDDISPIFISAIGQG